MSEMACDRNKRYRERQRRGTVVVPVEVNADALEMLGQYGLLDGVGAVGTSDRAKLGEAIELLLYGLAAGEYF